MVKLKYMRKKDIKKKPADSLSFILNFIFFIIFGLGGIFFMLWFYTSCSECMGGSLLFPFAIILSIIFTLNFLNSIKLNFSKHGDKKDDKKNRNFSDNTFKLGLAIVSILIYFLFSQHLNKFLGYIFILIAAILFIQAYSKSVKGK